MVIALHRFLDWLLRIDHPEPEPDWQSLVDAVDLAATIAMGIERRHIAPFRYAAQIVSNSYNRATHLHDWIDAELFALDAALARGDQAKGATK